MGISSRREDKIGRKGGVGDGENGREDGQVRGRGAGETLEGALGACSRRSYAWDHHLEGSRVQSPDIHLTWMDAR